MYLEHFGLRETPFSIVPDPRYLYMSKGHREALAHLLYGIKNDAGFVMLTGEVGTGKTTICRILLEQMPQDIETAFILNPRLSVEELLASVCDEFRIDYPKGNTSIKAFVDRINEYLLSVYRSGKRAVLIIEEAQNLSPEVLEQLRLLTNLETGRRKLLQIMLLGQPELRDMIGRPELRQLAQRITALYHLGPLSANEITAYVAHRIAVAGRKDRLFPASLMPKLFRLSSGIPRVINVICDRALLGAFVQGKDVVDRNTLISAAAEVSVEQGGRPRGQIFKWGAAGIILAACAAWLSWVSYNSKAASVTEVTAGSATLEKSSPVDPRWRPADFFPLLSMPAPRSSAPVNDSESGLTGVRSSVSPEDRDRRGGGVSAQLSGQQDQAASGESVSGIKAVSAGGERQNSAAEKSKNDGSETENVVHP